MGVWIEVQDPSIIFAILFPSEKLKLGFYVKFLTYVERSAFEKFLPYKIRQDFITPKVKQRSRTASYFISSVPVLRALDSAAGHDVGPQLLLAKSLSSVII